MVSRATAKVFPPGANDELDQRVPAAYARGDFPALVRGDPVRGWARFWRARAEMATDEFAALPALDAAHAALLAEGDLPGCELVARTAIVAFHHSAATCVGLADWLARANWGRLPPPALDDASAQAWWLAGELARVQVHASTECGAPATLAIRDRLLALTLAQPNPIDADARLIALSALFEYAEFEDDGRMFDVLLSAALPLLEAEAGAPLYRGRVLYRIRRCAEMVGLIRDRGDPRIDASRAEALAYELSQRHGLRQLRAELLLAQCFYAHAAGDRQTADRTLRELGEATDFARPLPAAWYYYLRGQAAARREEAAEALLMFTQGLASAQAGQAPIAVQQNHIASLAAALAQAGRWQEAVEHLDRLIAEQSGHDREMTLPRREIACFYGTLASAATPAQIAAHRARVLTRAEAVRWTQFSLLTPRTTARFLADALREGHPREFIAKVVRRRQLTAEPGFPRAWPWAVRVETLGQFGIEVDDLPVDFGKRPQRKPLELLMAMVALGPQPVAASAAMDLLWPDADGDKAKSSLDMAVLRLRRLLRHEGALQVRNAALTLDRTLVWVDAWAYLEDAACPYPGNFLPAESGDEIFDAQRERLRATFVQRTLQAGEALESSGRSADAVTLYEAALQHDPLSEALHRGAIRSHLNGGEPAGAVRAYQRCRDRLARDLGTRPANATQALVQGLIEP